MSRRAGDREAAGDAAEVLAANRAFYAALEARDPEGMQTLWSHGDDVACTHPGWRRLDGPEEVARSWQAIFADSRAWRVHAEDERAFVAGGIGVVVCVEVLRPASGHADPARMQATNVYRREGESWKMVHHHASPMPEIEESAEDDTVN